MRGVISRPRPARRDNDSHISPSAPVVTGGTEGRAEKVDEEKVTARRSQQLVVLQDVLVECLHHEEVHRHDPRLPRLRPGTVLVLPTDDMHVGALDIAAQRTRIHHQVRIGPAKPRCLTRPEPDTGQQKQRQPVPGRPAGQEHRDDLLIARPVDTGLRNARIRTPTPRVDRNDPPQSHTPREPS